MKKYAIIILRDFYAEESRFIAEMIKGVPVFMYTVLAALESELFEQIICFSSKAELLSLLDQTNVRTILYCEEEANLDDEKLAAIYMSQFDPADYYMFLNPLFPCRIEGRLNEIAACFEEKYEKKDILVTVKKEHGIRIPVSSVRVQKMLCRKGHVEQDFYLYGAETIQVVSEWDKECAFAWHFKKDSQKNNDQKVKRILEEKRLVGKQSNEAELLFIGHSIFDYWKIEQLAGKRVCNMGIAGITTKDYYEKVISQGMIERVPDKVVIHLGINDTKYSDSRMTVKYIRKIIDYLQENNESCRISCVKQHHTFYRNEYPNYEIDEINREIGLLEGVDVIDCSLMENEYGHLKYEYTKDGLHFNEKGYEVFRRILENENTSTGRLH